MYATAKQGQTVYYGKNHWEARREVVLVRYYKHNPYLVNNNSAVVDERGFHFHVDIKDLYRKPE